MPCMRKQFTHTWHIYVTKAFYVLLTHFCRENDLRASSGKFLRVKFYRPESLDFLCLWVQGGFGKRPDFFGFFICAPFPNAIFLKIPGSKEIKTDIPKMLAHLKITYLWLQNIRTPDKYFGQQFYRVGNQ